MSHEVPRKPWRGNAGCEQPSRMIIYDTETKTTPCPGRPGRVAHSLLLGVASYWRRTGDEWRRIRQEIFSDSQGFWSICYRSTHLREPLWVYSHNQAFDFTVVRGWGELDSGNIQIHSNSDSGSDSATGAVKPRGRWKGLLAVDGLPFIIVGRHRDRTIKIVDTLNYLPVSLAKLAKWCGLEKAQYPGQNATSETLLAYCRNDVLILEAAILKLLGLWKGRKLGNWQPTISSLAFSSFRHINPRSGIVAHGDDLPGSDWDRPIDSYGTGTLLDASEVSATERRSYFGGRVYLGYLGRIEPPSGVLDCHRDSLFGGTGAVELGPVYVLDVNGLYPSVMEREEYPVELLTSVRHPSLKTALDLTSHFPCVADVILETTNEQYPYRTERRVVYPVGRYATALAGVELRSAILRGHAIEVSNLCVYHAGRPFGGFVSYWWHLRERAIEAGDEVTSKLCKGVIVGLFGKLGQRQPAWKTVTDVKPRRRWGGFVHARNDGLGFRRFRGIAGVVQEMVERRDCPHTLTATAACVTAYGRDYMDLLRATCPAKSVLYQDTDSLFVLQQGYDSLVKRELIHPTRLGFLKLQGVYERVQITAPKTYTLDGHLVAAGVKVPDVQETPPTFEYPEFQRAASLIVKDPQGRVEQWKRLYYQATRAAPVRVGPDGWCEPLIMR